MKKIIKNYKKINNYDLKGFTLIELIVVIAIIGILATIIYPSFSNYLTRARDQKKLSEMKSIYTKLVEYNVTNGGYPSSLTELSEKSDPKFTLPKDANTDAAVVDLNKYNYIAYTYDSKSPPSAFHLFSGLRDMKSTSVSSRANCYVPAITNLETNHRISNPSEKSQDASIVVGSKIEQGCFKDMFPVGGANVSAAEISSSTLGTGNFGSGINQNNTLFYDLRS